MNFSKRHKNTILSPFLSIGQVWHRDAVIPMVHKPSRHAFEPPYLRPAHGRVNPYLRQAHGTGESWQLELRGLRVYTIGRSFSLFLHKMLANLCGHSWRAIFLPIGLYFLHHLSYQPVEAHPPHITAPLVPAIVLLLIHVSFP